MLCGVTGSGRVLIENERKLILTLPMRDCTELVEAGRLEIGVKVLETE